LKFCTGSKIHEAGRAVTSFALRPVTLPEQKRTLQRGGNIITPRPRSSGAIGSNNFHASSIERSTSFARHAHVALVKSPHKTAILRFGSSSTRADGKNFSVSCKLLSIEVLHRVKNS
jgi:hypothetical protein